MRLLLAATPAAGHLNPLLSLTRMAVERGDEVILTTGSHMKAQVEQAGATFVPLIGDADLDFRRIEDVYPERAALPPGPEQLKFDFEHAFISTIPAQAESLRSATARFAPDLVVTDSGFLGRLALVLDSGRPRPPIAALGITALSLPRGDGAPFGLGLPPATTDEERSRYAAIARDVSVVFDQPVRAHLQRTLASMGLEAEAPHPMEAFVNGADAYLQPTVRAFEYEFLQLPPWVHFVGVLPPPPGIERARPDWWDRLDGSHPIVLLTQGTAANFDFDLLINPALVGLAHRDDLQVVVTTGGRPIDSIRAEPRDNLFVAPFVDYVELIPRLALLVTNGGYGTVSLALQSGIPIVAAGRTEDKAEVGARVAWSGVGLQIASYPPSPAEIGAAVDRVLGEPSFRARARAISADFSALDTPKTIFGIFDRLVRSYRAA